MMILIGFTVVAVSIGNLVNPEVGWLVFGAGLIVTGWIYRFS